jgi:hypothetical protein
MIRRTFGTPCHTSASRCPALPKPREALGVRPVYTKLGSVIGWHGALICTALLDAYMHGTNTGETIVDEIVRPILHLQPPPSVLLTPLCPSSCSSLALCHSRIRSRSELRTISDTVAATQALVWTAHWPRQDDRFPRRQTLRVTTGSTLSKWLGLTLIVWLMVTIYFMLIQRCTSKSQHAADALSILSVLGDSIVR